MKKIVKVIPMLLVIVLIFALTTQGSAGSKALSAFARDFLVWLCSKLGIDADAEWWNTTENVRVLAHVIEYFALGIATGIALKKKRFALIVCACISFADQITKIFIPTRHFDWADIPFDMLGYCSGIAIAWVITLGVSALRESKERV